MLSGALVNCSETGVRSFFSISISRSVRLRRCSACVSFARFLVRFAPCLGVGHDVWIAIVEWHAGLVHRIHGRPKTFFFHIPQGVIAHYPIQELGIGEQLLGDRIVRIELGRLFGRYLSLFVALFVAQAVEFVEFYARFFLSSLVSRACRGRFPGECVLFFSASSKRGRFSLEILLGFADCAIRPSQQLIARGRFQTRRSTFLRPSSRRLKAPFGSVSRIARALASRWARSAATCRASTCCRAAVSSSIAGRLTAGLGRAVLRRTRKQLQMILQSLCDGRIQFVHARGGLDGNS